MALKKKPVTGMKDMLPKEMEIRDYVIQMIKDTYKTFGFTSIETPCVEHIENLCSKQGGDNEKLIFKILKRGEKLKLDQAKEEADLVIVSYVLNEMKKEERIKVLEKIWNATKDVLIIIEPGTPVRI